VKSHYGLPVDSKYSFEKFNIVILRGLFVKIRLWVGNLWFWLYSRLLAKFPWYLSLNENLMIRYLSTPYKHDDLAQLIRCATLLSTALLHYLGKPSGIEADLRIILLGNRTEGAEGHIILEDRGDGRVNRREGRVRLVVCLLVRVRIVIIDGQET